MLQGVELPQCHPHGRTRETIGRKHQCGGAAPCCHGIDDLSFEGNQLLLSVTIEHSLEGVVMVTPERSSAPELVAKGMWWIDVGARYPAFGHQLGRCVGPAVREQLW